MKAQRVKNIMMLLIFTSALFFSCPISENLSGYWSGPLELNGTPGYELRTTIIQSGDFLTGDASIWNSGVQVATYTLSAILAGDLITGQLLGMNPLGTHDINMNATKDTAGTMIDATFDIPGSGATGSFLLAKQ